MSPLLTKGDIRAPEVWLRVDVHGQRAPPIGVPEPLPHVLDALLGDASDALEPSRGSAAHRVATLKATPQS